jgi:hypothetical protein
VYEKHLDTPRTGIASATMENFRTDADFMMDVNNYNFTLFKKSLAYIGYEHGSTSYIMGSTGPKTNSLSAAYARRLGKLYVSAYYSGNLLSFNNTKTELDMSNFDSSGRIGSTTGMIYAGDESMTLSGDEISARNGLEFLVGILGMGLKLGFKENLTIQGKPIAAEVLSKNTITGITIPAGTPIYGGTVVDGDAETTRSFKDDPSIRGEILPSAAFGMLLPMGKALVKPFVKADLIFSLDHASTDTAMRTIVTLPSIPILPPLNPINAASEISSAGHREDYLFPVFAGGIMVDFIRGNPVMQGFKVEYITGSKIFSNDYDVMGQRGTVNGFVQWKATETKTTANEYPPVTTTKTDISITEYELSHTQHQIVPTYWYMNNITDNASIGFNLVAPVMYSVGKSTVSGTHTVTTTTAKFGSSPSTTTDLDEKTGPESTEIMVLNIHPVVYMGGTYKVLPNKLHLYGGLGVDLPSFTYSKTEKTGVEQKETIPDLNDPDKSKEITVKGDTETTAVLWLPAVVHAGVGGAFYFNEAASLETGIKVSSDGGAEVNLLFAIQK